MASWTTETLHQLDLRYAGEGIHPHQRPLRAAMDILGHRFSMGVGGNPEVDRITEAYAAMVPGANDGWPGMGTGIVAVVDQVRRVTAPVIFGTVRIEMWNGLGFENERAWWTWCREDQQLASATCFAFADLHDLSYGIDELRRGAAGAGMDLWRMAASNVSDFANTLPGTFSVDSVVQPICLAVELALKAAIVQAGGFQDDFRKRGGEGHDLGRLAARVARELPHRDDPEVAAIAAAMPAYVDSRYAPSGLSRFEVVRLALGAQFVAASTLRRHTSRDLSGSMNRAGWPAPRARLFTT